MMLLCTLQSNCLESRSADTSTSTVRILHEALVAIVGHGWIRVTYTWELARLIMSTTKNMKRWNTGSKTSRNWQTAPAPAPSISEVSKRNPTKQLASNLMLIDVSLRQQAERDGKCGVIDFSIVTPAAELYSVLSQQKYHFMLPKSEKKQKILNTFKRKII